VYEFFFQNGTTLAVIIKEGFRKLFFYIFDIGYDKFNDLPEIFRGAGELLYAADRFQGFRKIF